MAQTEPLSAGTVVARLERPGEPRERMVFEMIGLLTCCGKILGTAGLTWRYRLPISIGLNLPVDVILAIALFLNES